MNVDLTQQLKNEEHKKSIQSYLKRPLFGNKLAKSKKSKGRAVSGALDKAGSGSRGGDNQSKLQVDYL